MNIQKIQKQIKTYEDKIQVLKNKLLGKVDKSDYVYVPAIKKWVEIDVHHKDHSFDDLKEIYGKDMEKNLLTREEVKAIQKDKKICEILKIADRNEDFYIQQFNEEDREKGYVADFYSFRYWSDFFSDGDSDFSSYCRGVRFCRKKISEVYND